MDRVVSPLNFDVKFFIPKSGPAYDYSTLLTAYWFKLYTTGWPLTGGTTCKVSVEFTSETALYIHNFQDKFFLS